MHGFRMQDVSTIGHGTAYRATIDSAGEPARSGCVRRRFRWDESSADRKSTTTTADADPSHQGCIVYEFSDFATATLARDGNGVAIPRAVITADGNGLGPGLCSYDANSDTGVLLVITTITQGGTDIEFSLRATGVHP